MTYIHTHIHTYTHTYTNTYRRGEFQNSRHASPTSTDSHGQRRVRFYIYKKKKTFDEYRFIVYLYLYNISNNDNNNGKKKEEEEKK